MTEEKTLLNELRLVNIAVHRSVGARSEESAQLPRVAAMMVHFVFLCGGKALQKDVENEFHLRRSTASEQLHRLERDGYIVREALPEDGRSKCIRLTEKAKAEQKEIAGRFRRLEAHVDAVLTPEERETFFALCEKIRSRLTAATEGTDREFSFSQGDRKSRC